MWWELDSDLIAVFPINSCNIRWSPIYSPVLMEPRLPHAPRSTNTSWHTGLERTSVSRKAKRKWGGSAHFFFVFYSPSFFGFGLSNRRALLISNNHNNMRSNPLKHECQSHFSIKHDMISSRVLMTWKMSIIHLQLILARAQPSISFLVPVQNLDHYTFSLVIQFGLIKPYLFRYLREASVRRNLIK